MSVPLNLGHDPGVFETLIKTSSTRAAVEADRKLARRMRVRSVPILIARNNGTRLINGPIEDLRAQLATAPHLAA